MSTAAAMGANNTNASANVAALAAVERALSLFIVVILEVVLSLLTIGCRAPRVRMRRAHEIAQHTHAISESDDAWRPNTEKPRIQGDPRLPKMTVAGGFGGSGDDQSSLVERSERGRSEESQCGGEAEKLGHLRAPCWRCVDV